MITYYCVMITQGLVQTFLGEKQPKQSPIFESWLPKSLFKLLAQMENINGATFQYPN